MKTLTRGNVIVEKIKVGDKIKLTIYDQPNKEYILEVLEKPTKSTEDFYKWDNKILEGPSKGGNKELIVSSNKKFFRYNPILDWVDVDV